LSRARTGPPGEGERSHQGNPDSDRVPPHSPRIIARREAGERRVM